MARVFHFNPATATVTPLTRTFFPFVSHDSDTNSILGYVQENPNVEMTTKYICIAGAGLINSTNNVAGGPDCQPKTTVYTVISNPGWVAPKLTATATGGSITISWPASAGDGTLQSTSTLNPTAWGNVTPQPATALVGGDTYQKTVPVTGNTYFRLAP
jgi:hypothetical protein